MKTLFIGGIKSGKSRLAEAHVLNTPHTSPLYLATSQITDDEMALRIERHKQQRDTRFTTLEEPLHLERALASVNAPVLIECISMWINNMLYHGFDEEAIFQKLKRLLQQDNEIVFVMNDVGSGIIAGNALSRRFADINGTAAQRIAASCNTVYHVIAGIAVRIK